MASPDTIETALVLAGGRGERLRPFTDDRPKPMVPIHGKPLLEYHLHWLHEQGVKRAVLLVGYRQEMVHEHFAVSRVPGLTVEWVGEDQPLGRGGALRHGFERAGITDALVVATNGDVVTDQPLAPLAQLHRETDALATVMLTQMVSPYGIVDVDESQRIVAFREKPPLPYWLNAGVYVLSRGLMDRFPKVGDHETTLFPQLAAEGRIAGFRSQAYWRSVETAKDLREVGEYVMGHELFAPVAQGTA